MHNDVVRVLLEEFRRGMPLMEALVRIVEHLVDQNDTLMQSAVGRAMREPAPFLFVREDPYRISTLADAVEVVQRQKRELAEMNKRIIAMATTAAKGIEMARREERQAICELLEHDIESLHEQERAAERDALRTVLGCVMQWSQTGLPTIEAIQWSSLRVERARRNTGARITTTMVPIGRLSPKWEDKPVNIPAAAIHAMKERASSLTGFRAGLSDGERAVLSAIEQHHEVDQGIEAVDVAPAKPLPHPILCPKCDRVLARTDGTNIEKVECVSAEPITRDIVGSMQIVDVQLAGYRFGCPCGGNKKWTPLN